MIRTGLLGTTLALALVATGQVEVRTSEPSNVVVAWNQLLQGTIPGAGGVAAPRFYALTHIAMFDAINAIEGRYEPYHVRWRVGGGRSTDAAAAQAAHDVLVGLNPAGAPAYDALLAEQLGTRPSSSIRRGAAVGARVAQEILAWRANDGWVVAGAPAYVEPLLPGRWQPTPPNNPVAAFTHLQKAAPLGLLTSTQYLPLPPPALTSERYATDFNEVKLIGSAGSGTRTDEQTAIARRWASVATTGTGTATHAFAIWNNIVRDAARQSNLSLLKTARLFALVNVAIHDGLQTTQTSKFVYGLWRPVTAIRQADTDLNPATDPDPAWLSLIVNPPYPSYAGNMAVIGASAARALELALGTNDVPVTATWRQSGGLPDVTQDFAGFWQVADEQSMSRIYGGIHYRFDQEAGREAGRAVAEFVFGNYMRRGSHWDN